MLAPVRFVLIGCGGMGRRHLRGYAELATVRPGSIELAAVVDVDPERAAFLAGEAHELLGKLPVACTTLDQARRQAPELQAADVVTSGATHHTVAIEAFEAGLHVLLEKPMGVTLRACGLIHDAAARSGRVLSVAENFRRDPMARFARALLEAGVIGETRTVLHTRFGGGDRLFISPWRHLREHGGPVLDAGVHDADILTYLHGPVDEVFGHARLVAPRRAVDKAQAGPGGFYERFRSDYPEVMEATAPDAMLAMLRFRSGMWGHWVQDHAAWGPGGPPPVVLGTDGRLDILGFRSGEPLNAWIGDSETPASGAELLQRVPDFALDDLTAALFGGARLACYDFDFPAADRKLIALELAELAAAAQGGPPVEVGAEQGEAAVALVLAAFESSEIGRPVALAELRDGSVGVYQDPIDRTLGLLQ